MVLKSIMIKATLQMLWNTKTGYRGKGKAWHPQAISVPFISKFIEIYTNKDDLVLDLFLGSGTTAVACKNLCRNFIGLELKPEYCLMAENRLKELNKGELSC